MKEELTTAMQGEFLGDEVSKLDLKIAAVYGAISRGVNKQVALDKYKISIHQYESNIDRVLNDETW